MSNLSKNLIEKIKEKKITPKSRWLFWAKDKIFWFLFGLSIIIGGLSLSVIFYFASDNDLVTFYWSRQGLLNQVLTTLPYLWLFLVALVVYLANLNLHATKTGYRLAIKTVFALSLAASLIVGLTSYVLGFGHYLDYRLGQNIPFYKSLQERRFEFWLQPDNNRLAGKVTNFSPDNKNFELIDFQQKTWKIYTTAETFWAYPVKKEIGQMVRLVGEQVSPQEFKAKEIYPWQRPNFGSGPRLRQGPRMKSEINFRLNRNIQ